MLRLLNKDFKAAGLFWLAGLIITFSFALVYIQVNLLYVLGNILLTYLLTLVLPIIEDRYGLDPFFNSLPLNRAQVVKARYLSMALLVVAELILFVAVASGFGRLFQIPGMMIATLIAPAGLLAYLLPLILLELLFLPLYFRYGLGKSIWALLASLFALAVLLAGALRVVVGLTGQPLSEIFPVDPEILAVPYKPLLPLTGRLQAALGTAGLTVVGFLALTGLAWLSLRLSIRFYKRREF
jgi:hypothetical protein